MKEPEIKIRKGVPIPQRKYGPRPPGPIMVAMRKMEVGDCFDIPSTLTNRTGVYARSRRLGIRIEIRTLRNGTSKFLRVWRKK